MYRQIIFFLINIQQLYYHLMSISIQTDLNTYYPGQTVNGNIFMKLSQSFYSKISEAKITMHIFGQQHVKWIVANELRRPQNKQEEKQMQDPIKLINKKQIFKYPSNIIQVSGFGQEEDDLKEKPKYIRTPNKKYYQMKYFEKQRTIVDQKKKIYSLNKLLAGSNILPFSFKISQSWPGSFEYERSQMKGYVRYYVLVMNEPKFGNLRLENKKSINIWQIRKNCSKTIYSQAKISSCCLNHKGFSSAEVFFDKNGYSENQNVPLEIQVDNSRCSSAISSISIKIIQTVKFSSNLSKMSHSETKYEKILRGVPGFTKLVNSKSIKENFNIKLKGIAQSLCSGDLIQSQYFIVIKMNHDIYCQDWSQVVCLRFPIFIMPKRQENKLKLSEKAQKGQMIHIPFERMSENDYLKRMDRKYSDENDSDETIYYDLKQRKFQ